MANMSLSTHVSAPLDRVFNAYCDFERAAELIDGIVRVEMLTDGSVKRGMRFKETRIMFGREATDELEVTEFKPNELITVSADSCGARIESTFSFMPQDQRLHPHQHVFT